MDDRIGQLHSKDAPGIFKCSLGHNISAMGGFRDHLCIQIIKADPSQFAGLQMVGQEFVDRAADTGCRNIGFQTSSFTTITETPSWIDRSVAEFAGDTVVSIQ